MNKTLKVLLILAAIFIVFVGGIIIAAVVWFRANEGELKRIGTEGIKQGSDFGSGKAPSACVTEALTRVDPCGGIMCQAEQKVFLDSCLRAADPDAHFCDGVPKAGQILAMASWVQDECGRQGKKKGDQKCTNLLQAVPQHCAGSR